MNTLYIGFHKEIELPKGGCLLIDDEIREVPRWRHPRVFDPLLHSFNPLAKMDYRKARELADALYTISPQGQDTLTVRNGRRALVRALLKADWLDDVKGDEEVSGMIGDVLLSPVLKKVFCGTPNFTFNPNSVNMARINRAELGEFDALVLGLFLIATFRGQLVIPDLGFYGRDAHAGLIREGRLIAGVNTLQELSPRLRQAVLLIDDKVGAGTTADDAETLAQYAGLMPRTNGFNAFVEDAMA